METKGNLVGPSADYQITCTFLQLAERLFCAACHLLQQSLHVIVYIIRLRSSQHTHCLILYHMPSVGPRKGSYPATPPSSDFESSFPRYACDLRALCYI